MTRITTIDERSAPMLQKLTRGILFFGVLLLLLFPVYMVLEP